MLFCTSRVGGDAVWLEGLSAVEWMWASRRTLLLVVVVLYNPLCRLSPLVLDESATCVGLNRRNAAEGGLGFGV